MAIDWYASRKRAQAIIEKIGKARTMTCIRRISLSKGSRTRRQGVLQGQVLPVGDQDADRHGPEPDRQVHHRREEIRVDEAVASDPASLRDSLPLSPRPLCLRGEEFFGVCRNRGTPCSSRGEAATGQLRDLTLRPAGLIGISRGVLPWVCAHRPPLARGIIPTAPLLA